MYRLSANVKTADALAQLTAIFNKYNPAFPYGYQFADAAYEDKFKLELLIGKLSGHICRPGYFYFLPGFVWTCRLHGRATQ
jgi:hypothetical protein